MGGKGESFSAGCTEGWGEVRDIQLDVNRPERHPVATSNRLWHLAMPKVHIKPFTSKRLK